MNKIKNINNVKILFYAQIKFIQIPYVTNLRKSDQLRNEVLLRKIFRSIRLKLILQKTNNVANVFHRLFSKKASTLSTVFQNVINIIR